MNKKGRRTDLAVYRRREYLASVMNDTDDRQTILHKILQKFPDVCLNTIDRDCALIREQRREAVKVGSPDVIAQQAAATTADIILLRKKQAWGPMVQARKILVDILGAKAPEQLQIQTVCQACVDRADIEKRQVEGFELLTPEEQAEYERLVNKMLGNVTVRLLTEGE